MTINHIFPKSLLSSLIKVAKDATSGQWKAIIEGNDVYVVNYNPYEQKGDIIAWCIKGYQYGFREFYKHIRLFQTAEYSDTCYISHFYPEIARGIIYECLYLEKILINILNKLDILHNIEFDPILLSKIRKAIEIKLYNSNLDYLIKLTALATPGKYQQEMVGKQSNHIIQTKWRYDLNRRIYCINGKKRNKKEYIGEKCCFKRIDSKIYLCEEMESQHNHNARYLSEFNPQTAMSVIEEIIKYRKILIQLWYSLSDNISKQIGDNLINSIFEVLIMENC